MLSLLTNIERISSCKDRTRLPYLLWVAINAILGKNASLAFYYKTISDPVFKLYSWSALDFPVELSDFCNNLSVDSQSKEIELDSFRYEGFKLQTSELTLTTIIVVYRRYLETESVSDLISRLVCIYDNQMRLLDYSELDTLTRLLNRKTFDDTFERLLQNSYGGDIETRVEDRRQDYSVEHPAWICVIDIDHFKRVNDTFGHLFGDEVLLRMGDFMRKVFRDGDRLFRFGGEEFVVILNAANKELAAFSFERFRIAVENHEFPQIGQVTCSIGFTQVSYVDAPVDVVGRADEALYYAKNNGRNRVCCYESLIEEGSITKINITETPVTEVFDIDALFD